MTSDQWRVVWEFGVLSYNHYAVYWQEDQVGLLVVNPADKSWHLDQWFGSDEIPDLPSWGSYLACRSWVVRHEKPALS